MTPPPPDAPGPDMALIDLDLLAETLTAQVGPDSVGDILADYGNRVARARAEGDPLTRFSAVADAARDANTHARMDVVAHLVRRTRPTATELVLTVSRTPDGLRPSLYRVLDGGRELWDDTPAARADDLMAESHLAAVLREAEHESLGAARWHRDTGGRLRAPLPPPAPTPA